MKKLVIAITLGLNIALQAAETPCIIKQPEKLSQEPFELTVYQPKKYGASVEQAALITAVLALNPDTVSCLTVCCLAL